MLKNVVGGVRLDLLQRTISDYGLESFGACTVADANSRNLLENALFYRRELYNNSPYLDNANKTFRELFANPLACLVWRVATFKLWYEGEHEVDVETQIATFEREVQRFF